MGRRTLRNPKHPEWPKKGDRTTDDEVARKWALEYIANQRETVRREHLGLPAKAPALGAAVEEWLKLRSTPGDMMVEASTWQANKSVLGRLVESVGAKTPLDRIRGKRQGPAQQDRFFYLQDYFNDLLSKGYKRTSVTTERAILSGFFNWVGYPVVRETSVPAPEDKDVFFWSDTQLKKIRTAADRLDTIRPLPYPQARLAVELALATGARQQELFALKWDDLDADEMTVRFTRQRNRIGGGVKQLKGKENRSALVLPQLVEYLDQHEDGWRNRGGWMLHEGDGKPVRYQRTVSLVQRILDTANVNDVGRGWHDFRRTYGRLFLEATGGSGLHLLQVYLGHKKIETTQKAYGHLSSDHATRIGRDMLKGKRLHVVR